MIYHNAIVGFQILTMYIKSTDIITMKKHVDVEYNGLIHAYEIAQVIHRS
jgi:hypothetical protein